MFALKCIGYLIAAIAVLTVLASGAMLIIGLGILAGVILTVVSSVFFTASRIRAYIEGD